MVNSLLWFTAELCVVTQNLNNQGVHQGNEANFLQASKLTFYFYTLGEVPFWIDLILVSNPSRAAFSLFGLSPL